MSFPALCPPTVHELPPRPRLDPAAPRLPRQAAASVPAPEIARELRVSPVTVASRISAPRHGDDVTARGRAQLAAAALLTDSAHCRLTHGRFPALSLSAFAAGHPAAGRGRQP